MKSGFTFGNQYFFLISHLKFYNKNSDIDYQAKNLKKINIENIFPNMKVQLTSLKKFMMNQKFYGFGELQEKLLCASTIFFIIMKKN